MADEGYEAKSREMRQRYYGLGLFVTVLKVEQ